jgi:hypothetical protein
MTQPSPHDPSTPKPERSTDGAADAQQEQTALENVREGYGKTPGSAHISGKPGPVTEADGIPSEQPPR